MEHGLLDATLDTWMAGTLSAGVHAAICQIIERILVLSDRDGV